MATILSVPLASQLQVPFIETRRVYEVRERQSRMYHWTAMIVSQIIAEIPWNIIGSSIFFSCWYWTVGLPNEYVYHLDQFAISSNAVVLDTLISCSALSSRFTTLQYVRAS